MSLPSPTSALLDRHVSFTGTVAGHDLIVLGSLDGDLRLTGRLHVAAGSRMRARVQASVVELEGDFEGELRAETLRVTSSARARGVFAAERLSIEEGAVLEGDVQAPAAPGALVLAPAPGPAAAEATAASTAAVADETAGDEPSGAEPDPVPAATPA
jgi:cytoskeletal protein CcmA (bactofilin family)